jgi:hypothetical protein
VRAVGLRVVGVWGREEGVWTEGGERGAEAAVLQVADAAAAWALVVAVAASVVALLLAVWEAWGLAASASGALA